MTESDELWKNYRDSQKNYFFRKCKIKNVEFNSIKIYDVRKLLLDHIVRDYIVLNLFGHISYQKDETIENSMLNYTVEPL